MTDSKPHISIIAGPNGSGKSTCGPAILQNIFQISEFVNADTIATGLSAFQPGDVAIEASRIMLNRLKGLANRKENFAFERVAARVRLGGHNIPEQTIRRRYQTSLFNFFSLYQQLADSW